MMLLVRKCYSEVTFTDDDSGDYEEENGFIEEEGGEEGILMRVRDVIEDLRAEWRNGELSACPVTRDWCHGVWVSRDASSCYDAASREESYHLSRIDGKELRPAQLFRIYRAAGLAKGAI